MKKSPQNLRTWIEIDARAAKKNYETFRKAHRKERETVGGREIKRVRARPLCVFGIDGRLGVDGFCVDSVVEGLALRRTGIKKHILVLGPRFLRAMPKRRKIILRSPFPRSKGCGRSRKPSGSRFPYQDRYRHASAGILCRRSSRSHRVHLKRSQDRNSLKTYGIFTHFASAKDINYPELHRNAVQKTSPRHRVI